MERNEILIMNANNAVTETVPGVTDTRTVHGSGRDTAQPGDIAYTVRPRERTLGKLASEVRVTWWRECHGDRRELIVTANELYPVRLENEAQELGFT